MEDTMHGSEWERTREDLTRALPSLLSEISNRLAGPALERPDLLGYLADHQLRSDEIALLRRYVSENWPDVTRVYAAVRWRELFHISIEINSTKKSEKERHWPICEWLKEHFSGLASVPIFFHGPITLPDDAVLLSGPRVCGRIKAA